jgi:Zn finger protein HypA/HybF involved in hydrogenase expression
MSDKMVSKAPGVQFKNVHPTVSAGKQLHTEGEDSKYVRCKQCGFIVNKDINSQGSGYGNETVSNITTDAEETANAKDPSVAGGCPLCGSSEYE